MCFCWSSPKSIIRQKDKEIQKLRRQRNKTKDPNEKFKINQKIHKAKLEIDMAKDELRAPKNTTNNFSVNFNKNDNSKDFHLHGHVHIDEDE